ncbi:hypothetical protein LIER_30519 [Lithospermum erythrorhizon]|uniref:Aminotransferase-like plant mobile domain-containing protein n=1 Tax=Lithospermum erythrorhizon TaxID=34254 RepID=A0AAV3RMZ0_LITER
MISSSHVQWRGPLKIRGNFDYIPGYWEWTEDVLNRYSAMLASAFLTEAVQASLCVYDCSDEFPKAFYEHWCPSNNTLIIPQGEMSISMWDLLDLGGLYVTGRLFDEISFWNRSIWSYVGYEAADRSSSKVASLNVYPRKSSVVNPRIWDSADRHRFDVSRVSVDLEEEFGTSDLVCIYKSLSHISLSDNPSVAPECFPAHYLFAWLGSYLHAQHIASSRPADPQMMRYHGKGRGKVQSPPNRALFFSLRTGRISHRIGSELMVEPYNPYRFSLQFGYTPTVPGPSSSIREIVYLSTRLRFWRTCILSRVWQTIIFPGNASPRTPPTSYKAWLSNLFPSEAPGKSLPAGVCPSTLFFQSSGSSKRKFSSSSTVEDRDQKHVRRVRRDTSSSRGSRVASPIYGSPKRVAPSIVPNNIIRHRVVEVSSLVSRQEHTNLLDTGESPKCLTVEVAKSCPPSLPTLTIAQGTNAILRTGASSLWTCICDCLQGKSPETVQEQRFIVSQLDLELASTSQQIEALEEEIQAEQAKHQRQMLADLEVARLGLVGLL